MEQQEKMENKLKIRKQRKNRWKEGKKEMRNMKKQMLKQSEI